MSGNREGYFEEWYDINRDTLLKGRREKYVKDPDYAAKCRANSKAYRERMKEQRAAIKEGSVDAPEKRPRKPVSVYVNGRECAGWSIGILAERINRSIPTVNHWSKMGLLPQTPIRGNGAARLYTDAMISVVKHAVMSRGEIRKTDHTFSEDVIKGWTAAGVLAEVEEIA